MVSLYFDPFSDGMVHTTSFAGELRGMQRAHSLYGRLSWSSLVLPAARLATEGFVVTKALGMLPHPVFRFHGSFTVCSV